MVNNSHSQQNLALSIAFNLKKMYNLISNKILLKNMAEEKIIHNDQKSTELPKEKKSAEDNKKLLFSSIFNHLTSLFKRKNWSKKHWSRKKVLTVLIIIFVIISGISLFKKFYKPVPKSIYEVLVMTRSQKNSNPAEDLRTSLKAGDVIVVVKEGHKWSATEKRGYLILKMNLTEKQAQKLLQPDERELKESELSEEEKKMIAEEKKRAKQEKRKYIPEPRKKTIRPRLYYIDLAKYFPDFKANDTLNGQPYLDKIYDWSIVRKKKKIKQ